MFRSICPSPVPPPIGEEWPRDLESGYLLAIGNVSSGRTLRSDLDVQQLLATAPNYFNLNG